MKKQSYYSTRKLIFSLSSLAMMLNVNSATGQTQLPNILLILADDMGYGDIGSYNAKSKINWTASWIAFELSGTTFEVEISKVGGAAIKKAMVRPVASVYP